MAAPLAMPRIARILLGLGLATGAATTVAPAWAQGTSVVGWTPTRNVDPMARSVSRGFRGHDFEALLRFVDTAGARRMTARYDRHVWAIELREDAAIVYDPERRELRASVPTHPIRSDVPLEDDHLALHAACRTQRGRNYVGQNLFGAKVVVQNYATLCDVLRLGGGGPPIRAQQFECSTRIEPREAPAFASRARLFAVVEWTPGVDGPATFLTETRQAPTLRMPLASAEVDRHLTVRLLDLWLVDPATGRILGRTSR